MQRWLGLLLVPLLCGCIPIGVRSSTMPYASHGSACETSGSIPAAPRIAGALSRKC
jgi:hypothetical protein